MSGQNIGIPAKVELVAWPGDVSQLAARLCLSESELMRRLKPLWVAPRARADYSNIFLE
jgi:hypothetical protein